MRSFLPLHQVVAVALSAIALALVATGASPAIASPGTVPTTQSPGVWTPISTADARAPRVGHTAVWTGTEMLVWGGADPSGCGPADPICADGGRYDPNADVWRPIPPAPRTRTQHTAVWTGTEMIVFGGRRTVETVPGGDAYNPTTDTWRQLSDQGAPSRRDQHTAVWTGGEMLVWGGVTADGATGGRYNPTTDTWAPMSTTGAPIERGHHTAVWTGTEMIVWGGRGTPGQLGDGAAYNRATDTWRPLSSRGSPGARTEHTAVWTGQEVLIWGGLGPGGEESTGAAYNPTTDSWRTISKEGAPSPRYRHTAVWTGSEMVIWGGSGSGNTILGDGAAYNPATDTWRPLPTADAPGPRAGHTAVWTGGQMVVWGGVGPGEALLNEGARYIPPGSTLPPAPHDNRYFPQTGYRIDNDTFWDYFNRRGGIRTFGHPVSRPFTLQGFTTQFFQREIMQIAPDGSPRTMNILDPGLMPYTQIDGSTFPAPDPTLAASAPVPGSPTYAADVQAFVQNNAPDQFDGMNVNFYKTFVNTVTMQDAYPNGGGNPNLLPLLNLEIWGVPTSKPMVDPNNHNFVYLRFQRGIMHFDATTGLTQGLLLADYLKGILTGQNLPPDLDTQAKDSPFYHQYNPSKPGWVDRPDVLPATDLSHAFEEQ